MFQYSIVIVAPPAAEPTHVATLTMPVFYRGSRGLDSPKRNHYLICKAAINDSL